MKKNSSYTKNYIFEAFYVLLCKKKYDDISVCDLCEKAGVSRMSFYRNFSSKDDLCIQGLERVIEDIKSKILQIPNANFYTVIHVIFEKFAKFKDIFNSIENAPISKTLVLKSIQRIKEDVSNDYISKTSKYIPTFYFSAITMTMFEWLKGGATESADEMAKLITSLVNFE